MNKATIYTILLGGLMLAVGTSESLAWAKSFSGTRGQVRVACAAVGGELIEGASVTTCLNNKNSTGVTCGDEGSCTGSGPGPAPRVNTALKDVLGMVRGGEKVELEFSGTDGFGSRHSGQSDGGTATGGSGWDGGDIGQWHADTGGGVLGGGIFATH